MNATNQQSATVGVSDSTILGTNPSRKRLTISPPSAGRVTVAFGRVAVLDAGPTIPTGTTPHTWTEEDIGDLIHGEVHAIADAGGRLVGVTESFVPRS